MARPRFLTLLLGILAVLVNSGERNACAASPVVWQPYREVVKPVAPAVIVPQQYEEYVISQPSAGFPVDAITDVELNQLSADCCVESFSIVGAQGDPRLGLSSIDPMLPTSVTNSVWEVLPDDLIWHSYWAGAKEPRMSGTIFRETGSNLSLFDVSLGGRSSILRKGSRVHGRPIGWELQIEGAAQLRLNLDQNFDFDSADFRFGVPLIYAPNEQLQWKFAYYHLSSHVGDEFLVRNPGFTRINFSRDVLVAGASFFPLPAWRWYGETGWAFHDDEGSEPWEFQFGVDYAQPGPTGARGTPFFAFNGHLREEVDFGGNLAFQAGWLWRGQTGHLLRTGLHYYNGKSSQFEFFDTFEQQIGVGLWQEY